MKTLIPLSILFILLIGCSPEPVEFPDPNLAAAVRANLRLSPLDPITEKDLKGLDYLRVYDKTISDLTGLETAKNLSTLVCKESFIADISPLNENEIQDITPLAELRNLTNLRLINNQISNIEPLANLTDLHYLMLTNNKINDASPLANFKRLRLLRLGQNQIQDISPLADLKEMTYLELHENQIRDFSVVENYPHIRTLSIKDNPIQDMTPITNLRTRFPDVQLDSK